MMHRHTRVAIPVSRRTHSSFDTIAFGNCYGEQSYNLRQVASRDILPRPQNVKRLVPRHSQVLPDDVTTGIELVLASLDDKSKDVLRRYYVHGESVQQIAEKRRTTSGYVKMVLYNACKLVRQNYLELAERNADRAVTYLIREFADRWSDLHEWDDQPEPGHHIGDQLA